MTKLPQIKPKDLLRALQKYGFTRSRQTGSHVYLKHRDGRLTSISIHPQPIPKGTLRAILKQVKLNPEQIKELAR
jgi:predicted RNA binding protein YcfA (HicA-like mRNA interferase family)